MRRAILLIICIVGVVCADWMKVRGTSESPLPPKKEVIASDSTFVFIRNEFFGFIRQDTIIDLENFQRIIIPEEPIDYDSINIGKPQIPYVKLLIAVPDSADFDLTVYPSDYTLLEDYLIYPVPEIVFETDTVGCVYSKESFSFDASFYQKDTIYPGKFYEIESDGHWRGQRVLEVFLYPIQYNPQKQQMYIYSIIDLRIEYLGEILVNTNGLGPFEDIGLEILLNYSRGNPETNDFPHPAVHYYTDLLDTTNIADYIIITHDDFLNNRTAGQWIYDFAQWRVDHNLFHVGIVKTSDIFHYFPLSDHHSIRDFLIYAFDNWHAPSMSDDHFAYCLFIGDWDYVPIDLRYVYYGSAGWYWNAYEGFFRDLTSDNWEDIMLGRWPVKETVVEGLINIAQRTIDYEKYPDTGNWRRRGLLIAGLGPGPFGGLVNTSIRYFTDIEYDTFIVGYPEPDSAARYVFRDSVHKYLNRCEIVAAYYGHGGYNGWGRYDNEDNWYRTWSAETLENSDSLPVILSYACVVGAFHWDHPCFSGGIPDTTKICLGESFLFNPDGGAVAFYGGTSPIWINLYNTEPTERILRDQQWILGKALVNSTPNTVDNCFCLLGDPALDLGDYTAYPDLPDLVVRPQGIDISLLPPYPYGDVITVQVKIWNIGSATAYSVDVDFGVILGLAVFNLGIVTIDSIQPRDTVVVTAYWQPSASFPDYYGELGDCEFWVEADPQNLINESWEFNNTSSITKEVVLYPNQSGWPKSIPGCIQPAIAHLYGTGSVAIVCPGLDSVYAFDKNGNLLNGWPQYFKEVYGVVLGNIDANNRVEVIAVSGDSIKIYDCYGNILAAWQHPGAPTYCFSGLPALGRIANGVTKNIVILSVLKIGCQIDREDPLEIYVFDIDGTVLYDFFATYVAMAPDGPSIGNVIDGGHDEIIVSYLKKNYAGMFTEIFNCDGLVTTLDHGSLKMTPALAKLDGDNYPDIVIGGRDGIISAHNVNDNICIWETQTGGEIKSSPAIGNINPYISGKEIGFGNYAWEIWAINGNNGSTWGTWPFSTYGAVQTSPALAKIDNNPGLDIVIGSNDQYIYALNYNAESIFPFPLPLFGLPSSPIIGDIDRDWKSEIILTSSDGYLHVWKNVNESMPGNLIGPYQIHPINRGLEWPQFHHDYQRTGFYGWGRNMILLPDTLR